MKIIIASVCLFCAAFASRSAMAESINLTNAKVVIRQGTLPAAEKMAPVILTEELARRTGVTLSVTSDWPANADTVIAISTLENAPAWQSRLGRSFDAVPKTAEAFAINVLPAADGRPLTIAVTGRDARGAMFGVGKLLRVLDWKKGQIALPAETSIAEAPDKPLRGHQIGYRDTANSWDEWTFEQYDQYFRDMVIFGANAMENIPFQEDRLNPLMKYPREVMNIKFAELCEKYDLEHWVWVPVLIDLPNEAEEAEFLKKQDEFYQKIKRLDAIFVPGGDPGENHLKELFPHLEKMAKIAIKTHPKTKIWLSLQHATNTPEDVEFLYSYLEKQKPSWFGGMVMGPGSPPMEPTRKRLPKQYKLRWYPDITHVVRCQYPVPWLDPIWGLTLGREPVNPRPVDYTDIYRMDYTFTDGFLSYSDGVHDDFNKNLWTQLGWNPNTDPRDVAREYARFFFRPDLIEMSADGLFALESDARGPVASNGSVGATLLLWKELERQLTNPGSDWRFHMHLFRAYYAYFTRNRLLYEQKLEREALAQLAKANPTNIDATLKAAREILNKATTHNSDPELYARLLKFGDQLFKEVGLQTSVPKYHASGSERGAVLDFIDYPLNNRWWLEAQFDRIAKLSDKSAQLKQIKAVVNWDQPGEDGYYDVMGDVSRSPRVAKLLMGGDMMRHRDQIPNPTQRWLTEKPNELRLAWHQYLNSVPSGIEYNDLDPSGKYIVKLFAHKDSPLLIDGAKAKLIHKGETFDKVTEQIFEVPADAIKDGTIVLKWEPIDEKHLNWREWHYVTEIWVMKKPSE